MPNDNSNVNGHWNNSNESTKTMPGRVMNGQWINSNKSNRTMPGNIMAIKRKDSQQKTDQKPSAVPGSSPSPIKKSAVKTTVIEKRAPMPSQATKQVKKSMCCRKARLEDMPVEGITCDVCK